MNRVRLHSIVAAVAIVALLFVPSAWTGLGAGVGPSTAVPTTTAGGLATVAAHPHPAILCPPGYPGYGQVGNPPVWPITPDQLPQIPCPKINIDEVHATYSSPTADSGQRWTTPVHLPVDGSTYQADSYAQFYVGMVVGGDNFSEWHQSYASVVFTPSGTPVSSWSYSTHILALVNSSHEPGGGCPANSLNFSWNDSYYCEVDEITTTLAPSGSIAPGDFLSLTFVGDKSRPTTGLGIWLNDSTTPSSSWNTTLNTTTTGKANFHPFYDAACADTCMLQWGVRAAFGLGASFTLCPFNQVQSSCDSYNDTTYNGTHPVELGIPHFWSNGGYNGDYRYFAPESASGVCNNNVAAGILAFCNNQNVAGGTGYYPSFSYNGSLLDFGVRHAWTTQDFGGSVFELLSTGAPNDLTPFYFHSLLNDSLAGFVTTGASINITTELQDLGNVRYAGVTYRVNSGSSTNLAMALVSGTRNDGTWVATIPTGPNGWVNFTVNATNNASAPISAPAAGTTYHVQRGPLPTFTVNIANSLGACGGIRINGPLYPAGTAPTFQPGTYPILGVGCYPYVFNGWTLSNGITVTPTGAQAGNVTISAGGTIQENWKYVRPLDTLVLYTNPTSCGQIILGGNGYFPPSTGQSVQILDGTNVSLGETGCGGFSFSGWTADVNFTVLGNNIVAHGNGSLTANYVSSTSSFTLIFHTSPANCGGVLFQGAGYTDGQTLQELAGSYAIAGDPCFHWGFLSWSTSGSVSVAGSTLTLTGPGTLTETNQVLTVVTFQTSPGSCGSISWDGTTYVNGQSVVVANDSTHSVFATACSNHYLFSITGTPGITVSGNVAIVNTSGTVSATFLSGNATNFVGFLTDPPSCGGIYLSGVRYTSSNFTYVATGSQATVSAQPCVAYGFVTWVTFGQITILNSTATFSGPGAIEAVFRPLATIFLYTSPQGCGSIDIAGVSYPSNSTLQLTEDKPYSLGTTPCLGYAFSSWVNSSGALLSGGNITLTSGSVLTAVFLPVHFSVVIWVTPARCGGVRIAGQDVGNGTVLHLSHTTYSVIPAPCTGDHLVNWTLSANLSIANTTLWVNGSGTLAALYEPVPPVVSIAVSSSSFSGIAVPFGASVAVPVPPYTYFYTWSFGEGASVTTPVNFTSHTYSQAGTFTVTVTVTDPYNRTATASAKIQVIPQTATSLTGLTTPAIAGIGLAIIAVLLIIVIGSRYRRPPAEPTPSLQSPAVPAVADTIAPNDSNEMEPPKP